MENGIEIADIVQSVAGRDRGKHFFVMELRDDYALLADGKLRKIEKPKNKKLKHMCLSAKSDARVAEKIRGGGKVLNSEIRKALAEYASSAAHDEGGT